MKTLSYSVKTSQRSTPVLFTPASAFTSWADSVVPLRKALVQEGAVLLRGFPIDSASSFRTALADLDLVPWDDYLFRESGRSVVDKNVFNIGDISKYVAHGGLHSENCYAPQSPRWIAFWCSAAPTRGGETLLCNMVDAFARLDTRLQERFRRSSRECIRLYRQTRFAELFKTTDLDEIQKICASHGCATSVFQLDEELCLQVSFKRPYVIPVPESEQESVRININYWSMGGPPQVWQMFRDRYSLLGWTAFRLAQQAAAQWSQVQVGWLASNHPGHRVIEIRLDASELEDLGVAIANQLTAVPWRQGDVLIVDNAQMLHCGLPWEGSRILGVMMGDFC